MNRTAQQTIETLKFLKEEHLIQKAEMPLQFRNRF